ncbi:MAG: hypothetical protein NVSMB10_17200 [Steroidobacteraceae bacterium]
MLPSLAGLLLIQAAHADSFSKVYYDAGTDELVVTMKYRGTNPDHAFTLSWGKCKRTSPNNPHEVAAQVLDDQWRDHAKLDFTKTTRFSLAKLPCRPAKLTLRTAPRFYYTILIPG